MNTYTVHITTTEYYTIEVQAQDENLAEEKAWLLFPHYTPDHIDNNVTAIINQGE